MQTCNRHGEAAQHQRQHENSSPSIQRHSRRPHFLQVQQRCALDALAPPTERSSGVIPHSPLAPRPQVARKPHLSLHVPPPPSILRNAIPPSASQATATTPAAAPSSPALPLYSPGPASAPPGPPLPPSSASLLRRASAPTLPEPPMRRVPAYAPKLQSDRETSQYGRTPAAKEAPTLVLPKSDGSVSTKCRIDGDDATTQEQRRREQQPVPSAQRRLPPITADEKREGVSAENRIRVGATRGAAAFADMAADGGMTAARTGRRELGGLQKRGLRRSTGSCDIWRLIESTDERGSAIPLLVDAHSSLEGAAGRATGKRRDALARCGRSCDMARLVQMVEAEMDAEERRSNGAERNNLGIPTTATATKTTTLRVAGGGFARPRSPLRGGMQKPISSSLAGFTNQQGGADSPRRAASVGGMNGDGYRAGGDTGEWLRRSGGSCDVAPLLRDPRFQDAAEEHQRPSQASHAAPNPLNPVAHRVGLFSSPTSKASRVVNNSSAASAKVSPFSSRLGHRGGSCDVAELLRRLRDDDEEEEQLAELRERIARSPVRERTGSNPLRASARGCGFFPDSANFPPAVQLAGRQGAQWQPGARMPSAGFSPYPREQQLASRVGSGEQGGGELSRICVPASTVPKLSAPLPQYAAIHVAWRQRSASMSAAVTTTLYTHSATVVHRHSDKGTRSTSVTRFAESIPSEGAPTLKSHRRIISWPSQDPLANEQSTPRNVTSSHSSPVPAQQLQSSPMPGTSRIPKTGFRASPPIAPSPATCGGVRAVAGVASSSVSQALISGLVELSDDSDDEFVRLYWTAADHRKAASAALSTAINTICLEGSGIASAGVGSAKHQHHNQQQQQQQQQRHNQYRHRVGSGAMLRSNSPCDSSQRASNSTDAGTKGPVSGTSRISDVNRDCLYQRPQASTYDRSPHRRSFTFGDDNANTSNAAAATVSSAVIPSSIDGKNMHHVTAAGTNVWANSSQGGSQSAAAVAAAEGQRSHYKTPRRRRHSGSSVDQAAFWEGV